MMLNVDELIKLLKENTGMGMPVYINGEHPKQTDSCYYAHYIWDNSDKSNSLERGHRGIRIQTDYSKTQQTLF